MKNKLLYLITATTMVLVFACTENNTEVNNNNNPNGNESENATTSETNGGASETSTESEKPASSKTDGELIFEGGKLLLNASLDAIEKQRIKDSINRANKEKMYAYQIGLQYREKDAYEAYNKLIDAGVTNVYVFKAGRKEYYVVRFEAKGDEELNSGYGDFKTMLGDNGSEGVKVVNLMNFCDKKETIIKQTETSKGNEISCLICD